MEKLLLGSIADIQTGPFGSQLHKEDYVEHGTPIVTVEHLGNRVFTEQNLPMVSDGDKERLNKYVLGEGDIVFSRVGSVDRCSYVDSKHSGWMFSGRCLRVRPSEKIYPLYLYYYFCMESTKQFVRNIAVGATMPSINTKLMGEIEVLLPEIAMQKRIATILSSIDDKIELNTAINENLELQARAIFSNLFPKCMSNGIAMSNIIDVRDGTHDSPKAKKEGYSLITSKHLQAYSVNKKEANLISYEDFNKINERSKVEYGDILISMIGTVGIISFISDKSIDFAIKNVGLFRTSQSAKLCFYVLNYLKTNEVANYIEQHLAGSTQKYISLTELRNLPIRIPSDEDLQEYNELISPIYGQIIALSKENQWLTELRDTLLPKLMNGEIDVSEVKI